jgi:hypothetical protein
MNYLKKAISSYLEQPNGRQLNADLEDFLQTQNTKQGLGDIISAHKYSKPTPANTGEIYNACISFLATEIIKNHCTEMDRFISFSEGKTSTKQRIPMLPELQKAIERRGYSFTLLRGTSYLCEVQISAK